MKHELETPFRKAKPNPPKGRPKGFKGVAKMIGDETRYGKDLVAFALKIWRDDRYGVERRWVAFEWLSKYYFGKPATEIEIRATMERNETHTVRFEGMSDEQLAEVKSLRLALLAREQEDQDSEAVDAEFESVDETL